MSNDMNKTVREFYKAVEGVKTKKSGGYDTQATVRRIEDGVAWVHIPDGVDETPAKLTISAKEGDVVQVRVVNGRAFLVGNASAPPTDNTEAVKAMGQAGLAAEAASIARQKADEAVADAATAHEAAAQAQDSADIAQTAAENAQRDADDVADNLKSVVAGATTVEKAVSVMQTALEAVVDYDPTTDTTKEYFWHDANGAHVLGTDSGYRNDVDSSGMKVVEVATEDAIAEFGANGAQLGKTDNSHLRLDSRTLQLVDRDGTEFFEITDMRDEDGYAFLEMDFVGDGNTTYVDLPYLAPATIDAEHPLKAYINGTETTAFSVSSGYRVIFQTVPASGAAIKITYYSTEQTTKSYTLGARQGNVGPLSFVLGALSEASGLLAHAEGANAVAKGNLSRAQNYGTIASGEAQTAMGRFNVEDTNGNYAVIVGNGTMNSNRSNAMTLDWNGILTVAGFAASVPVLASKGTFTGNINATDTPVGIYAIGASGTVTNLPSGITYGNFIQLPYYRAQLIVYWGGMYFRSMTGSPLAWNPWRKVTFTNA